MPSPPPSPVIVVNGWSIYAHPLFVDQFETLLKEVEGLRAIDPTGYREKKKAKLFAAICKMVFEVIPRNPGDRVFWQGTTLGSSTGIGIARSFLRDATGCSSATAQQEKLSFWLGLTTRKLSELTAAKPTPIQPRKISWISRKERKGRKDRAL